MIYILIKLIRQKQLKTSDVGIVTLTIQGKLTQERHDFAGH